VERLFSIGLQNTAIMAVLAILVWGVTRIWRSAPVAHFLWLLVLLKLVTPPVVFLDMSAWTQSPTRTVVPSENPAVPDIERSVGTVHDEVPKRPQSEVRFPGNAESSQLGNVIQRSSAIEVVPPQPAERSSQRLTVRSWETIRSAIAWTWIIVAALIAIVAGVRIVQLRRILSSLRPAERQLQSVADDLSTRMGLKGSAAVFQVDSETAPFVWCFGDRAMVVLPRRLFDILDEQQLEMVIAHELAHLRRRDHWVRVAELAVSILYWWNPMAWWVRRQLHAAEEECCDAWVAWLFPSETHRYAEALLKSAEAVACSSLVLSSPFLNKHTLKGRVEMVLKNRSQRSVKRLAVMCLCLFAVITLPLGISVVRGQVQDVPKVDHTLAQGERPRRPQADSKSKADIAPQSPAKPNASEADRIQGHWAVESCQSEAAALKVSEWDAQRWRWTIKGDEITWGREGQEWKLNFKIGPDQTPKQIDLTFLDGPHKGKTCPGIYDWDGEAKRNLKIVFQDPGVDVGRPTSFEKKGGGETSQITLRPLPPIDPVKELALFQGTWCWDFSQPWTWPQPIGVGTDSDGRKSEKRWMIDGNQITWVGRDGQRVYVNFTIDPFKAPKQIEFTFLNGPRRGQKSIGIYESRHDEDHRELCMTDPGADAPRPTDFSAGGTLKQSFMFIYRVAPPVKRSAADELKRLQGIWKMELCDSTLRTFGGTQKEAWTWQWTIRDDEILWSRQGDVWKMKLSVDLLKTPQKMDLDFVTGPFEMDLTYLSGPFKGAKCQGIYGWGGVDGQSLMIAIQDPGSDAPRPKIFHMNSAIKTGLMILRSKKPSDAEREIAAFLGTWTLRNFDTGRFETNKDPSSWPVPGGKGPDKSGNGSELRWVVKQNEIKWTSPSGQEIKVSFTIDPFKMPKEIDLTFLNGPHTGETCPGIYQRDDLDQKIIWVCVADPGSKKVRPKEFSYKWGAGCSLLSLFPFQTSGDR
jgi:uncharacterized protein (TIGR03067 family)